MKILNKHFQNETHLMTFGRLKPGDVFERLNEYGQPISNSRSLYIKCGYMSDNGGSNNNLKQHPTNAVSLIKGSKSMLFDTELVAHYPDAMLDPGKPVKFVD